MKVTAILRKDQPDKNGLCKILLRINNGDKRTYLTSPYKILPSQFKKGKVVSHPDSALINDWIKRESELFKESPTERSSFQTYCTQFISHHEKAGTRGKGTIRYYKGEVSKFLTFTQDLPIHRIDKDLIKSYIVHMKRIGNVHNTVWKSLKFLKTILGRALKDGMIHKNPFQLMEPYGYKQTTRIFLDAKEVGKIGALKIQDTNPLYNVSLWFLLQCYTGLRVGDLKHLRISEILASGRIIIQTSKTGTMVSQPLNDEVKKILQTMKPFSVTEQEYNRQLKSLAALAGITKNLSSHVARHTAAMRMAELGISKEVAAKILGHRSTKTTDVYYKIQDKRVDEEMQKFSY